MQLRALRAFDPLHVMAGGEAIGAQIARDLEQVGELHAHIALHARYGGAAGHIFVGEVGDHGVAKGAFIIEHIMSDADAVRDRARVAYILARAAAAGAAHRRAMIIELERDADHFRARLRRQRGDDARIHAARHGDDDAPLGERLGKLELGRLKGGLHGRAYSAKRPGAQKLTIYDRLQPICRPNDSQSGLSRWTGLPSVIHSTLEADPWT